MENLGVIFGRIGLDDDIYCFVIFYLFCDFAVEFIVKRYEMTQKCKLIKRRMDLF